MEIKEPQEMYYFIVILDFDGRAKTELYDNHERAKQYFQAYQRMRKPYIVLLQYRKGKMKQLDYHENWNNEEE